MPTDLAQVLRQRIAGCRGSVGSGPSLGHAATVDRATGNRPADWPDPEAKCTSRFPSLVPLASADAAALGSCGQLEGRGPLGLGVVRPGTPPDRLPDEVLIHAL